jgi:hypothetical protein
MSGLPHISDVISQVQAEVASLEKTAAPKDTVPVHKSRLGTELMKCAELLRQRGNQVVTYPDVFALNKKLQGQN